MPEVLRRAAGLGLLLGLAVAGCRPEVPVARPNVVLFVIDTLRADHVGAYGYARDTTPHLDRLAARGARFEVAIAPSSWSAPSHASIVTGQEPTTHGVLRWGDALPREVRTLAERLREAGYVTGLFSSHYSLHHGVRGIRRGLDHAEVRRIDQDRRVLRAAGDWVRARTGPFFLTLVIMTPHAPYRRYPRAWDATLFTELPEGGERTFPFADTEWHGQGAIPGSVRLGDERRVGVYVNRYDRSVRQADALLGAFVEALAASGHADDTVLVVTSDHGEGLGEHGVFAHEVFLYEFLVRVPLVVHFPGRVPAGRVIGTPVQLVDVAPTLLGFAGVPGAADLDGLDLSTHLEDGTPPPARMARALYAHRGKKRFMVRSARYKLIHDPVSRAFELYDLAADPDESDDLLAGRGPGALPRRHAEAFAAHRRELARLAARFVERDAPAALPPAVRAELHALGYLEEEPAGADADASGPRPAR